MYKYIVKIICTDKWAVVLTKMLLSHCLPVIYHENVCTNLVSHE